MTAVIERAVAVLRDIVPLRYSSLWDADQEHQIARAMVNFAEQATQAAGYVPGVFRCAKCDFRLIQSNLNAHDGTVTARDAPGERCPNDGSPMWRVTWKDEATEAYKIADSQMERALAAERALLAASSGERGAWQDIATAPYSTPVRIRAGHMTFEAALWPGVSEDDEGRSCDQWQAVHEGEHPPCWSEGACWSSNLDEVMSLQPDAWQALATPATVEEPKV